MSTPRLTKIISGGQTGADQAGLDVAIKLSIPHGGWIPKGRLTEAGPLPESYLLQEMPTTSYPMRTAQNIIDSDATLIFTHGKLSGGSKLTVEGAIKHNKPYLHIDLSQKTAFYFADMIRMWINDNNIKTLNVAGSRISKDPDIYDATMAVLELALKQKTGNMEYKIESHCTIRFATPDDNDERPEYTATPPPSNEV